MNNNQSIRKTTYTSSTAIIIIGILILTVIIVYLYNNYKNLKNITTPTGTLMAPSCPDYWDSIGNGRCQNSNKLGSCSKENGSDIMDFSGEVFTNVNTGNYSKCKWANACNISWSNVDRLC